MEILDTTKHGKHGKHGKPFAKPTQNHHGAPTTQNAATGFDRRGTVVHECGHETEWFVARRLDGHAAAASQECRVVASGLWGDVEDVEDAERAVGELEPLLQRVVAVSGSVGVLVEEIDVLGEAGDEGAFGESGLGVGSDVEDAGDLFNGFTSLYRRCVAKNTGAVNRWLVFGYVGCSGDRCVEQ